MQLRQRDGREAGAVVAAAIGIAVVLGSFSAGATSDGVYDHERQGCTLLGYTYDKSDEAEPGCQGFTVQAGPGEHPDLVRLGFSQTPEGVGPHAGSVKVGEAGSSPTDDSNRLLVIAFDSGVAIVGPKQLTPEESEPPHPEVVSEPHVSPSLQPGNVPSAPERPLDWSFTFWMDDNFAVFGEHHSISQANDPERDAPVAQGPVSGGGIRADTHPDSSDPFANADPADRERPLRAADARMGFCADGWCMTAQTQERTVYQGGAEGERAAYDYSGLQPRDCDFRDPGPNCREYYDNEGRVYVPAGLTIYQDPDPQAPSGFGPTADAMYPLAPTHAGFHGVLLLGVWVIDLRQGATAPVRSGVLRFEPTLTADDAGEPASEARPTGASRADPAQRAATTAVRVPATKGTYPLGRDVPTAGASLGSGPASLLSRDPPDVVLEAVEPHIP